MTPKKTIATENPGTLDASAALPFPVLRQMLLPYRDELQVVHDDPGHFYANCAKPDAKGKPQFFAAVKTSGNKCLFHLMPVYDAPELLASLSPGLRKRMQGKSCFQFTTLDEVWLQELADLVARGAASYRRAGKL